MHIRADTYCIFHYALYYANNQQTAAKLGREGGWLTPLYY